MSMAHSLETRVPFLDNDLVDLAMQVPVGLKLRNLDAPVPLDENQPGRKAADYFRRTGDGKLILRKVPRPACPARCQRPRQAGVLGARLKLVQG